MTMNLTRKTHRTQQASPLAGFTLLELLIAIGIIAILLAIAFPTYQQYIAKSYRSHAHSALFDLNARMERFFIEEHSYEEATLARLGAPPFTPDGEHYALMIDDLDATTYTLTAKASEIQSIRDKNCYLLTLNHLGQKAAWKMGDTGELEPALDCWH